jgi:hypothetical protein
LPVGLTGDELSHTATNGQVGTIAPRPDRLGTLKLPGRRAAEGGRRPRTGGLPPSALRGDAHRLAACASHHRAKRCNEAALPTPMLIRRAVGEGWPFEFVDDHEPAASGLWVRPRRVLRPPRHRLLLVHRSRRSSLHKGSNPSESVTVHRLGRASRGRRTATAANTRSCGSRLSGLAGGHRRDKPAATICCQSADLLWRRWCRTAGRHI